MTDDALKALYRALDQLFVDVDEDDAREVAKRLEREGFTVVEKAKEF